MNSISTEPDYYMECGEPVYVQSHMLQTVYSQHQKIPEKSTLMIEFQSFCITKISIERS